jgi:hypothetical protein
MRPSECLAFAVLSLTVAVIMGGLIWLAGMANVAFDPAGIYEDAREHTHDAQP